MIASKGYAGITVYGMQQLIENKLNDITWKKSNPRIQTDVFPVYSRQNKILGWETQRRKYDKYIL